MRTKLLILSILILSMLASVSVGQDEPPLDDEPDAIQTDNRDDAIAKALDLTLAQRVAIRSINREHRLRLHEAQQRLQSARQAADMAIYSDTLNEADIAAKIQEFAVSQAEITKIRLMNEVAVRGVLSPQQLVRFRTLRERIAEQRRKATERRQQTLRRQQQQKKPDGRRPPGANGSDGPRGMNPPPGPNAPKRPPNDIRRSPGR